MFTSSLRLKVMGLVWARTVMLNKFRVILVTPDRSRCLSKNRLLTSIFTNGAAVPKTVEQLVGSIRVVIEHTAVGTFEPTIFSSNMAPNPL